MWTLRSVVFRFDVIFKLIVFLCISFCLWIQLNAYIASLKSNPSGVRTLADLIKFNDAHKLLEEPVNFTDQSM